MAKLPEVRLSQIHRKRVTAYRRIMSDKVKITTTITLTIQGTKIELTKDEAKELKRALDNALETSGVGKYDEMRDLAEKYRNDSQRPNEPILIPQPYPIPYYPVYPPSPYPRPYEIWCRTTTAGDTSSVSVVSKTQALIH
jgi:hypothetical protein